MCSSAIFNPNPMKHTKAWVDIGNKSHAEAMNASRKVRGTDSSATKKATAIAATSSKPAFQTMLGNGG